MEYLLDLFGSHDPDPVVYVVDATTFDITAAVPVTFVGQTMRFDIPLAAIGDDDGSVTTAMVLGDADAPSDWAPDTGHGTIESFSDVPWLTPTPASGEIPAGGSTVVSVGLGSPTLEPGAYHAELVFDTDAPVVSQVTVDTSLAVGLPSGFGEVDGSVVDGFTFEPIHGASVTLHAEWPSGTPLDLVATTGVDGSWTIIGPAGTWPVDVAKSGYHPSSGEVDIVAGHASDSDPFVLDRAQAHATLDGDTEPSFLLPPGRKGSATVLLGNVDGHADLHATIGEVGMDAPPNLAEASVQRRAVPAGVDPNARTTRGFGAAAAGTPIPPRLLASGDVLNAWPTGMTAAWGVGYARSVWLSDAEDHIDAHFSTNGDRLGQIPLDGLADWGADMAFDPGRGLIWQVNVGGDNGIYGLDPSRWLRETGDHGRPVGPDQSTRSRV